jgi:hypothetical protein
MIWSDFTLKNYKQFKNIMVNLQDNNKLLEHIKNERLRISKFIEKHIKYNVTKLAQNTLKERIDNYAQGHFVIRDAILESCADIPDEYLIEWGENKMHIKTTETQYEIIKNRMNMIIHFLEYIKNKSKQKKRIMDIYLILTPLQKTYPEEDIIKVHNVNTGYTSFGDDVIFIWRYEEFDKVLFHEAIHYYDMDMREISYHNILHDMEILNNEEERFYEAYTDFNAIIYHLIYLSLITKIKIKKLLEIEYTFIMNQAQQVNAHFNLGDWVITPPKMIKQETSAFSYYILKYMIFNYMLNNNFDEISDYNKLLTKLQKIGFKTNAFIKTSYLRMTLLQLS